MSPLQTPPVEPKAPETNIFFIGNLPYDLTEPQLQALLGMASGSPGNTGVFKEFKLKFDTKTS